MGSEFDIFAEKISECLDASMLNTFINDFGI